MTVFPWWWVIGLMVGVAALSVEIQFMVKDYREHRNVALAVSSLFVLIYSVTLILTILWFWANRLSPNIPYWIKAGVGTCVTVSLLAGLHIADVITRRRK